MLMSVKYPAHQGCSRCGRGACFSTACWFSMCLEHVSGESNVNLADQTFVIFRKRLEACLPRPGLVMTACRLKTWCAGASGRDAIETRRNSPARSRPGVTQCFTQRSRRRTFGLTISIVLWQNYPTSQEVVDKYYLSTASKEPASREIDS